MVASNRRKHARVKAKQVASRVEGGNSLHIGLPVENVSMGGLYLRCPQPLAVGTRVTLELTRPGVQKPIQVTGKVVSSLTGAAAQKRALPPGMGVAFDELAPHLEVRLEGLVAAIDPKAVVATVGATTEPVALGDDLPPSSSRLNAIGASGRHPALWSPSPSGRYPAIPGGGPQQVIDALKHEIVKRDREIEMLRDANKVLRQRLDALTRGDRG